MSFNNSHFLKAVPVGTLATMMAQPQHGAVVDVIFVDTEVAEKDDSWNSCVDEIGSKFGLVVPNLIVYRAKPSGEDNQASKAACLTILFCHDDCPMHGVVTCMRMNVKDHVSSNVFF